MKILFPVDFSKCSDEIFQMLSRNHMILKQMLLLYVVEKGETQEEVDLTKEEYRIRLERLATEIEAFGIQVDIHVEEEIDSKHINKLSIDKNVDFIMMGMTGESL